MVATYKVYEHFIRTGVMSTHIPTPRGEAVLLPKMTPYFTYEVGIDEPPHPDQDIAQRFVEVAISDCKYGCKIYADPFSEVRVLVHSRIYGCDKTMAKLEEQREDGEVRPGDTVEFNDRHDPMIVHTGKVLNRIEPDDGRSESFRIAEYFIVDLADLRSVEPGETYQQAYERLVGQGIMNETQIAAYFGVSVESLRAMKLRGSKNLIVDGTEFQLYDWVKFQDLEDPEIVRRGQVIRYISPNREHPYGGYYILGDFNGGPRYVVIYQKNKLSKAE